ncbi:MAG: ThiF family adenylyltransferase [Planctomycetes bacterium]|nr:ThiF family adenylyltransferase [Planctomycetota bacterium]
MTRNLRPDLTALGDLVDSAVTENARVAVVGAGALGSNVVVELVSAGVACGSAGKLVVIDPEPVSDRNVGRTAFTVDDIGDDKVAALGRHVHQINSAVRFHGVCARMDAGDRAAMAQLADKVDLLALLCDDFDLQAAFNEVAYQRTVILGGGVARGADSAALFFSAPRQTACGNCVFRPLARRTAERANALGCDVRFVAALAACVALGLLHAGTPAERFYRHLIDPRRNLLLVGLRREGIFAEMEYARCVVPVASRVSGVAGPVCSVCRMGFV